MEQADTGPGCLAQRGMAQPHLRSGVWESAGTVGCRRPPEVTAERPCEDFMAAEPGARGDADDRLGGRHQRGCGALQPETLRVLFGRLADDAAERAMKVKHRPAGARCQGIERDIAVQTRADVSQQLQDVALCWHAREE
jgi:hypothetical protein